MIIVRLKRAYSNGDNVTCHNLHAYGGHAVCLRNLGNVVLKNSGDFNVVTLVFTGKSDNAVLCNGVAVILYRFRICSNRCAVFVNLNGVLAGAERRIKAECTGNLRICGVLQSEICSLTDIAGNNVDGILCGGITLFVTQNNDNVCIIKAENLHGVTTVYVNKLLACANVNSNLAIKHGERLCHSAVRLVVDNHKSNLACILAYLEAEGVGHAVLGKSVGVVLNRICKSLKSSGSLAVCVTNEINSCLAANDSKFCTRNHCTVVKLDDEGHVVCGNGRLLGLLVAVVKMLAAEVAEIVVILVNVGALGCFVTAKKHYENHNDKDYKRHRATDYTDERTLGKLFVGICILSRGIILRKNLFFVIHI